jgi:hypothetical protein
MKNIAYLFLLIFITYFSNFCIAKSVSDGSDKGLYRPRVYRDRGGELPAPGTDGLLNDPQESSYNEEAMFATYSFNDANETYNIEFYYRPRYNRIRARVLIGEREVKGLFNCFYKKINSKGLNTFSVAKTQEGIVVDWMNDSWLIIKESELNTDVIYETLEEFTARIFPQVQNPGFYLFRQCGMLSKTFLCRIISNSRYEYYLVDGNGNINEYTLENIRIAYNREGINAETSEDFLKIGRSIIQADNMTTSGEIILLSSVGDIPGYRWFPLKKEKREEIRSPWSYLEKDSIHWFFYTYKQFGGIVSRYTVGFQQGQLSLINKTVLGKDIGDARPLEVYEHRRRKLEYNMVKKILIVMIAFFILYAVKKLLYRKTLREKA